MAIASSAYESPGAGGATIVGSPETVTPGLDEKLISAASTTGKPLTRPELGVVYLMTGVVVAAYLAAIWIVDNNNSSPSSWFQPAEGVTVFAIFYVLAQAIERLLIPIARLVPTTPPDDADQAGKASVLGVALTTRSRALKQRTAAVKACAETTPVVGGDTAQAKASAMAEAQKAANWQEVLQQAYVNATTVWALGAALAFLLCAWLDVYLLNAIAIERWDPPIELDLLVTGLAIGGGTVPLHDLIGRIQKKDDKNEANPATSPTEGGGRAGIVLSSSGG